MTLGADFRFDAIGTQWSIETSKALSPDMVTRITSITADFTSAYSRFDKSSLVYEAYNSHPEAVLFPESITRLIEIYKKLYDVTNGKVNPLVGVSLETLGYDPEYSLVESAAQPAPAFDVIELTESSLKLKTPALLDIGAIGKGLLIDTIAEHIGIEHDEYIVDGSGDMRIFTRTEQHIGLEDPRDPARVIGAIWLKNTALCASAMNRRSWGNDLHHILDATTGKPANTDFIATWAIHDSAMIADALTTGLFFAAPRVLSEQFGPFYYAMLNKDGSVLHNIGEIGEIYT